MLIFRFGKRSSGKCESVSIPSELCTGSPTSPPWQAVGHCTKKGNIDVKVVPKRRAMMRLAWLQLSLLPMQNTTTMLTMTLAKLAGSEDDEDDDDKQ